MKLTARILGGLCMFCVLTTLYFQSVNTPQKVKSPVVKGISVCYTGPGGK